jgi:hypothetical protein
MDDRYGSMIVTSVPKEYMLQIGIESDYYSFLCKTTFDEM